LAAPASDPPEEDDDEELADEDREDILFRGISVTLREFRVESNKKPCGFPVFRRPAHEYSSELDKRFI
jgi:hypothetical protein